MSSILALWKVVWYFLRNRYNNKQAVDIMKLHNELNRTTLFGKKYKYKDWVYIGKQELKNRVRLGQKISYMNLFKQCKMVDENNIEIKCL